MYRRIVANEEERTNTRANRKSYFVFVAESHTDLVNELQIIQDDVLRKMRRFAVIY